MVSMAKGSGELSVAKLESLAQVGIFVRDWKKARDFYTRKVGLQVRKEDRQWDYLALGATKGGPDASLTIWQPVPSWGAETYESGIRQIGTVTGIGFRTSSLAKAAEALRGRGVKVEIEEEAEEGFGRFTDLDGNTLFLVEPGKVKAHRAGLSALEFVTVVSRDVKRASEFFSKALGMRSRRVAGEGEFVSCRLSSEGTAISPFTPTREMYRDPKDYDADMAHIGENTAIGFTARDVPAAQETLMARGVRFLQKAEKQEWGGMQAKFLDADDNVYSIEQI